MGFLFSKLVEKTVPIVKKETLSPEITIVIEKFNTKYPELKFVLSSSNGLDVEQKKIFDKESSNFFAQVPVPTEDNLYSFILQQIKKYNISIKPTDIQIQKLLTDYTEKYSYMEEYLDNIKTLDTDKQVLANKTMQDFLETYPLGSVDEFYKVQLGLLRTYSLSLPPEEEGFCNKKKTKNMNYSKISIQMDSILMNKSLTEKQYASFSR